MPNFIIMGASILCVVEHCMWLQLMSNLIATQSASHQTQIVHRPFLAEVKRKLGLSNTIVGVVGCIEFVVVSESFIFTKERLQMLTPLHLYTHKLELTKECKPKKRNFI